MKILIKKLKRSNKVELTLYIISVLYYLAAYTFFIISLLKLKKIETDYNELNALYDKDSNLYSNKFANLEEQKERAQKELKTLQENERGVMTFNAAVVEDVESCRPEYDYEAVQKTLSALEETIINLKHQINKFNSETGVDGFDKTIDEMLVYIPMLTRRKEKLNGMKNAMAKTRESVNMRSTIIDYRYANYDLKKGREPNDLHGI